MFEKEDNSDSSKKNRNVNEEFNQAKKIADRTLKRRSDTSEGIYQNLKKSVNKYLLDLSPLELSKMRKDAIIDYDNSSITYKLNYEDNLVLNAYCKSEDWTNYKLYRNDVLILTWDDVAIDSCIERLWYNLRIYFDPNGFPEKIEHQHRFDEIKNVKLDLTQNKMIGCFDVETFTSNIDGSQNVFAAGYCVKDEPVMFYLGDKGCKTSDDVLINLFDELLYNFNDYTIYAHNFASFDALFLLSSLIKGGFKIKPTVKEQEFISMVVEKTYLIKNKNGVSTPVKKTIKIHDSLKMLNKNLHDLSVDFQCKNIKSYFPYSFVNHSTLNYVGPTPPLKHFNITEDVYNKIYTENYNLKNELLNYLAIDLLSLKEIMFKFNDIIYNDFKLNITRFKTISGLSFNVYLSRYYNPDVKIKVIKGHVENELRKAYFGGMVYLSEFNSRNDIVFDGYYYDINSMYPFCMLKDMPVGDPIASNDTNLEKYFGYCYAIITPPESLSVPLLPYRSDNIMEHSSVHPLSKFSGIYFSELLKEVVKHGYKVEVTGGYKFKRGKNVFKNFVEDIYGKRVEAGKSGNECMKLTYKLILNSLYGRFGMKNIGNKAIIVDNSKIDKYFKTKNVSKIFNLNSTEKSMVIFNKNINAEAVDYIKKINPGLNDDISSDEPLYGNSVLKNKIIGVPSSVSISAAITAYAHMMLIPFKTDPNNKLLYSDTDSILVEKKIDDLNVSSTELGKMKYEHRVVEGHFIHPKFYAFVNSDNKIIKKGKGVNTSILSLDTYKKLNYGEPLTLDTTVFVKDINNSTIKIVNQKYTIPGRSLNPIRCRIVKRVQHHIVLYNVKKYEIILYIKKFNQITH